VLYLVTENIGRLNFSTAAPPTVFAESSHCAMGDEDKACRAVPMMLCFVFMLIAWPCQEWTAVRADVSARKSFKKSLEWPYYNAKNDDFAFPDTMTSFGLYDIHCTSDGGKGCSPTNPFGYTPDEPIGPWAANKNRQYWVDDFCNAKNPDGTQFFKLGGSFPYWRGDVARAQQRVRAAFCGGRWQTPRWFAFLYIGFAFIFIPASLTSSELFFMVNFLQMGGALIIVCTWGYIHGLLVDSFPWMSVEYGFSFILAIICLSLNCFCVLWAGCIMGASCARRKKDEYIHEAGKQYHAEEAAPAPAPVPEEAPVAAFIGDVFATKEKEPEERSVELAKRQPAAVVDNSSISSGCDACMRMDDGDDDGLTWQDDGDVENAD
jgi:hypothetical protein